MAAEDNLLTLLLLEENTVTLYLDGTEHEFVENFIHCQGHYRFWLLWNSAVRVTYGRRMLYTTPVHGTFYYVLRYEAEYVVLVIDARTGWLVGFFNNRGIYEMRICHAMEHGTGSRLGDGFEWVKRLIVNWSSISQQVMRSLSNQRYNPHDCGIRELLTFDDLLKSTFYLHVDAYLEGIFKHTALPPPPRDLSWCPVDLGGDGEEDIPLPREPQPTPGSAVHRRGQQQLTKKKGLSGGKLGGPPVAPEIFLRWSLSDDQEKDYDELVSYLEEELGLKMHKARRFDLDCTNHLVKHHAMLPDQNLSAQDQIDSDTINEAPQALPTSVGSQISGCSVDETLQALPTISSLISSNTESLSPQALPTSSESAAGVTIDDLRSLCSQEFITDPVVVHAFNRLSDRIDSEDVLLVNPAMSHLLGNSDATVVSTQLQSLGLPSRKLVLFPVNNQDPHLLGEGTHWSLLVFDRNHGGRPCLAHNDSSPGDANLRAARRLAASLLPYLPPETKCTKAPTPKQNNGTDCALYMIKCAEVICGWWRNHAAGGSESHWLGVVARGVTMDSVDDLRTQLIHDIGQLLNGSSSS
uniref:Ubiquitin-like protease family profile domain-containing protein n=1 Tax=Oryza glumipatula TaxID=40148 RepID=A0A0E0AX61_9ORYZ